MKVLATATDHVVIGAGVEGLRDAIELVEAGRVLVLSKKEITNSNPKNTQSGIFFFLNEPAPTKFSPLPLPDALPISRRSHPPAPAVPSCERHRPPGEARPAGTRTPPPRRG